MGKHKTQNAEVPILRRATQGSTTEMGMPAKTTGERSLGRCPIWCHRFHLRKRRNAGHKASEEKPREGTEYSTRKWLRARIPLKAQQQRKVQSLQQGAPPRQLRQ